MSRSKNQAIDNRLWAIGSAEKEAGKEVRRDRQEKS